MNGMYKQTHDHCALKFILARFSHVNSFQLGCSRQLNMFGSNMYEPKLHVPNITWFCKHRVKDSKCFHICEIYNEIFAVHLLDRKL